MRAHRLPHIADLALNLALPGLSKQPRVRCSAPLYDKNAIFLRARAIHEVCNGCWQAQGVRAQLQPELATIADLADGPGRQLISPSSYSGAYCPARTTACSGLAP